LQHKPNLVFFVTEDWYFCGHWMNFAIAARNAGYEVSVITRTRKHGERIRSAGLDLIPIELSRQGVNPLQEWRLLRQLISIYRRLRPALVHHVAMKPIVYGTLAARVSRADGVVNAVAGLGYVFSTDSLKARLLRPLIRSLFTLLALIAPCRFVFQNPDDARRMFTAADRNGRVSLIKGVGVDLQRFRPAPFPQGIPVVILAARLIWEKGLGEFTQAARILLRKGIRTRLVIVGEPDDGNPGAVPRGQLAKWTDEGIVEWWGHRDDMPEVYASCHIFCLPTHYGEGLPTALLEAAACGRPLVATDAPGCREIVMDGENGLLVPLRDPNALAQALEVLINDPELRQRMGRRGREIVSAEFSQEKVVASTLKVYAELLATRPVQKR
jgi:glycosyltransferase involved in cell wall biosynthesis